MEQPPRLEEENKESTPMDKWINAEGLKGISADLERLYSAPNREEMLRTLPFQEIRETVDDYRNIVKNSDGTPLSEIDAIRDLRIIAKEHRWEDAINWDTVREEARKMGYQVTDPKTSKDAFYF